MYGVGSFGQAFADRWAAFEAREIRQTSEHYRETKAHIWLAFSSHLPFKWLLKVQGEGHFDVFLRLDSPSFSLNTTYFLGVWPVFGREGSLKRMGRVELEYCWLGDFLRVFVG